MFILNTVNKNINRIILIYLFLLSWANFSKSLNWDTGSLPPKIDWHLLLNSVPSPAPNARSYQGVNPTLLSEIFKISSATPETLAVS